MSCFVVRLPPPDLQCQSVSAAWTDSRGDACQQYEEEPSRCQFASFFANASRDASVECCRCGGGKRSDFTRSPDSLLPCRGCLIERGWRYTGDTIFFSRFNLTSKWTNCSLFTWSHLLTVARSNLTCVSTVTNRLNDAFLTHHEVDLISVDSEAECCDLCRNNSLCTHWTMTYDSVCLRCDNQQSGIDFIDILNKQKASSLQEAAILNISRAPRCFSTRSFGCCRMLNATQQVVDATRVIDVKSASGAFGRCMQTENGHVVMKWTNTQDCNSTSPDSMKHPIIGASSCPFLSCSLPLCCFLCLASSCSCSCSPFTKSAGSLEAQAGQQQDNRQLFSYAGSEATATCLMMWNGTSVDLRDGSRTEASSTCLNWSWKTISLISSLLHVKMCLANV